MIAEIEYFISDEKVIQDIRVEKSVSEDKFSINEIEFTSSSQLWSDISSKKKIRKSSCEPELEGLF